jgi:ADP-heptose:LPS heptosyltransferase
VSKELLVIRLSAMGDVAMTIPVIDSFSKSYPDVKITMLSSPKFAPLFEKIPNLTFFAVDTKNEFKGVCGIWRLFRTLKKNHSFDYVIDLHDVLRSKILRMFFRLLGTPVAVIDKGRSEKRALVREENKILKPLKSTVQRYSDTFASATLPLKVTFEKLFDESPELPLSVQNYLGEKKEKWLAIAPFAQHKGKIFPIEKMASLIEYYSNRSDLKIILFGGGGNEKSMMEEWASRFSNVLSVAGRFTILEELNILQMCDVLLSMDSSNMHFASLVGTPVVSIWGATHPYAGFYGYHQDIENAVQLNLECRPCSIYGNKPCKMGDYPCLNRIGNKLIISKLEKYI